MCSPASIMRHFRSPEKQKDTVVRQCGSCQRSCAQDRYIYIYTLGLERLFLFNHFRITRIYVIKGLFPEIAENRVWDIFGFPSKNQFISKPRTMPNPDPPCWGTWLSDQEWSWIIMFLGGISYSTIKYTLKICKDTRMLHAIPKFREESHRWPNKQPHFFHCPAAIPTLDLWPWPQRAKGWKLECSVEAAHHGVIP
jgi:hypothetical protein